MTLRGSANLCGSENVTQSRFVVVRCATLTAAEISSLPLRSVL